MFFKQISILAESQINNFLSPLTFHIQGHSPLSFFFLLGCCFGSYHIITHLTVYVELLNEKIKHTTKWDEFCKIICVMLCFAFLYMKKFW